MDVKENRDIYTNLLVLVISSVISIVIAIIAIESYCWKKNKRETNWHDPNTKFDSILGWAPIPSLRNNVWGGVTSNSFGFRSDEIDNTKNAVIILGDSVGWGYGVGDRENVVYHLQQQMNKRNYQAHNLCVSGYAIDQYYLYLKRNIDYFEKLDSVILIICTDNDLYGTGTNLAYGKRKPLFILENEQLKPTQKHINKYCLRNLLSKTFLLRELERHSRRLRIILYKSAGDMTIRTDLTEKVVPLLLKKIHDMVSSRGADLLVVLSPSKKDYDKQSDNLKWFKAFFSSHEYAYIDLFDIINEKGLDVGKLYIDNEHYTDYGNHMLAKIIFEN